jgi:processive 1,2-diacylglycerol beta-glucosyltransferase
VALSIESSEADPMKKPLIAILSVSAGAGHVRAAEALGAAARKHYPDVATEHIDVMDEVSVLFRRLYAESYLSIVEHHPALWGYIYQKADGQKQDQTLSRFRRTIQRLNAQKFMARLKKLNPDRVICTHFLPAELLARKIAHGKFFSPVFVQVTDFDVHTLWVQKGMSGYFAASPEVAFRMADRGIAPETIHCTGIPIMPVFGESLPRAQCAAELGLDPARPTLLMMSGGYGIGSLELLAERLLGIDMDFQIIALAGKNQDLLARLRDLAGRFPGRLFPIGFTTTIERVMAAADLAITKPGGLTTSECLAMGLPMIVVSPIPGQEERNADFLLENGAALKAYDGAGLVFRAEMLLRQRERVGQMRRRAAALGRPDAARQVLDIVMR